MADTPVLPDVDPTVETAASSEAHDDSTLTWLGKIWQKRAGHRGRALALAMELGHEVVICMQCPAWWLRTPRDRDRFYRTERGKEHVEKSFAATSFRTYDELEQWHATVCTFSDCGKCPHASADEATAVLRCPRASAASSRCGLRRGGGGQVSISIATSPTVGTAPPRQRRSCCRTASRASWRFSSSTITFKT